MNKFNNYTRQELIDHIASCELRISMGGQESIRIKTELEYHKDVSERYQQKVAQLAPFFDQKVLSLLSES